MGKISDNSKYPLVATPADADVALGQTDVRTKGARRFAFGTLWSALFRPKLTQSPVTLAEGGTGSATAAGARTALGLGNVDNTSDLNKPVSSAQATAINLAATLSGDVARAAGSSAATIQSGVVTLAKLATDVIAVLQSGLDPAKYQGLWTPATNTPTIPAAGAGNAQHWYFVSAAGTATGNAAGTYAYGECIVSSGSSAWLKRPAPPTVIPAFGVTEGLMADLSVATRSLINGAVTKDKLGSQLSPPYSVADDGDGIGFAVVDRTGAVLFGIRADGTISNPQINQIQSELTATTARAEASIETVSVAAGATSIAWAIVDKAGKVLIGWNEDGTIVLSQITDRIAALEAGALTAQNELLIIYGQSNATGSLDYSQNWRFPPMAWDTYPPGFSGETDGPRIISSAPVGTVRTLNSGRTAFQSLTGAAFGVADEGPSHGIADTCATAYPEKSFVILGHGVGGQNLAYLDKPTSAEITAGTASGITIGASSAEKLMQDAAQSMASIGLYAYDACATPYYKGMWLVAKCKSLSEAEAKTLVVPAMFWMQGESDASNASYAAQLRAFYATYEADVRAITGQIKRLAMLVEQSNYSTQQDQPTQIGYTTWVASGYTDLSAYTAESARVNDHASLNSRQLTSALDGLYNSPEQRIYLAAPRYPFASRIHVPPHAARAHGEQLGKVFRKVAIEGKEWSPVRPISWWIDGAYIFLRFSVPKPPLQLAIPPQGDTHVLKSGQAYGLNHNAGAIQQAKVVVIGQDLIRIEPDVAPAQGQVLTYVVSTRYGSICDSDTTPALYLDRGGSPNVLRNYCIPFTITL